jgi:diacylglycerol kinase (ATP)
LQQKIFIVCNPQAGNKKGVTATRLLTVFLTSQGIPFEINESSREHGATKLVFDRLNDDFTDMVVIGGDGTLNQAVNGLKFDIPVGIIPTGTGNDYVKNLTIGKNLTEQIETAVVGNLLTVDLGLVNKRKFLNGLGIGFDGQIVHEMEKRKIPLLTGQAKYYFHVLHILSSYRERKFNLSVDQQIRTESLILLTIAKGTTFGGGFKLTPHANLADGKLAICEIGSIPTWKRYANLLSLQNGTHNRLDEVSLFHAKKIHIAENSLLYAHLDGEYFGNPPFDVSVKEKSLRLRIKSK